MSLIEINHNPPLRELRLFGGLWLPIALVLLGFSLWRKDVQTVWLWVIGVSAAASAVAGWTRPSLVRSVYVGSMYVAFPIGWVVSQVLLGLIFYTLVTGIALIMRWRGRDLMGMKFDKEADTYWAPHSPVTDPKRYFRQF